MYVRRAIIFLTLVTMAMALYGCGVAEGYEAGAALQVISNPGTVVTIGPNTLSGNEITYTVHNYPRKGADPSGTESMDILITETEIRLIDLDGGIWGPFTAPGNAIVKPGTDTEITIFGIVPGIVVEAIRSDPSLLATIGNFRADLIIKAREVDINGDLGDSMDVADSTAVIINYAPGSGRTSGGDQ